MPANAMAVWQAKKRGIKNFAVLISHVLVPPGDVRPSFRRRAVRVQGFSGAATSPASIRRLRGIRAAGGSPGIPIVVTGFEPLDLLEGIYRCVCMLEAHRNGVDNSNT